MNDARLLKAYSERARHWRQAARNWEKGGNQPAARECLQQAARFERLAAGAAPAAARRAIGRVAPEERRPLRRAAGHAAG